MNKEVNEKKKRYAIIISFLVLMICITGGTYAYFALTASNNSVTGSGGGASLNLSVTKVYPTSEHNNKNMIPQLESTLDEAISLEHKCVDGNGNVICQVYSATVTNVGSTTSVLNGTISFEGVKREAGVYDDNWNMLASWDELVNDYGLDITIEDISYGNGLTTKSLTYILRNNTDLLTTSKVIVDDSVEYIGSYQFYFLNNVTEILLPNNVVFQSEYELGSLSNLKNLYYSGNSDKAPWNATNATVLPVGNCSSIPNLKWRRIDGNNTLGIYNSYYASPNKVLFEENTSFESNTSGTYYFVIWIDETGEVQNDNGDFIANIEFDSSTGGLTSTVNSTKFVNKKLIADNPVQNNVSDMFKYTNEGKDSRGNVNAEYITNGMYMMEDEDGPSYYFRGNVDNLVQFGTYNSSYNSISAGTPIYWRIIRINGDGTLRLLYNGTSKDASSDDFIIGNSGYSVNSQDFTAPDIKYTGYTYDRVSGNNGTDSIIKEFVDTWYSIALEDGIYEQYVTQGRFCSDTSGYNENTKYFGSSERITNGNPTLVCPETSESYGGSYRLNVGLVTVDELMLGGNIYSGSLNSTNYFNSYNHYYSMTPYCNDCLSMSAHFIYTYWYEYGIYINPTYSDGVRPVINVDPTNLKMSGSGSVEDPYVLTPQ